MILIGENIHILSKAIAEALQNREKEVFQNLARKQAAAGVDYLDLNVGPVRKDPDSLAWLVEVVQEVVDLPLSLDTLNPEAMEKALSLCKKTPLINSASGKQESKEKMLPLAKKYNCDVVISTLTDAGIPSDATSRAESIMETIAYANQLGIPNENIWIDPIMMPISVDQKQVEECLEFVKILPDISPGCKSTIGLSNILQGVPPDLRSLLSSVELVMLERYNLYSAIVNSFDEELIKLIRGEMPDIKEIIYKAMDEEIDISSLNTQKEINIVKTVNVLMGRTLYSHSWLEV
jgi:cobalamin-dependent methionine synthase I